MTELNRSDFTEGLLGAYRAGTPQIGKPTGQSASEIGAGFRVERDSVNAEVTIRIDERAGLFYEVRDHAGHAIARSTTFASICKLEESLAALYRACAAKERCTWSIESGVTTLRFGSTRRAFRIQGALQSVHIEQLLECVAVGRLVDARPPERRRTDLSQGSCRIEM